MAKIHIEVVTPGNGKAYEFTLDDSTKTCELLDFAKTQIEAFEGANISFDEKLPLICAQDIGPLSPETALWEAGVKSGHKLILL